MKKTKLIIIGVVVALLLVGGAYAVWASQANLLVNAGSGELDIEISKVTVGEVSKYVEFDRDSITISEDRKSASISIENLYPGAEANSEFEITNIGTVPVALDKAVQKILEVIDTKTNKKGSNDAMAALQMEYKCYVVDEKGKVVDDIGTATVQGDANNEEIFENNDAVVEAGNKVILEMTIVMKESADDNAENKLFKFSVTPFFIQSN
jgi:hypothetical protein